MKNLYSVIYYIIIAAVAVGVLLWLAGPDKIAENTGSQASASDLVIDEAFFDFGTISMAAGVVSHEFKVRNMGADEAVVEQIYTSCMCTQASFVKGDKKFGPFGMAGHGFIPKFNGLIEPNEEAVIKVEFDPAAHGPAGVGPVDRVVYIVQNNNNKPIELKFKAVVRP